jgi:hypothetical protein
MLRQYTIPIYTTYKNNMPKMSFVQHDTESSRIVFQFYDDVNTPTTGITYATGTVKRKDGKSYTYGAEDFEITENEVTFILPPSALYTVGECISSVSIYGTTGTNEIRLTTQQFKYIVTEDLIGDTPIDETNEYPVLTELINSTQDLKNAYAGALQ